MNSVDRNDQPITKEEAFIFGACFAIFALAILVGMMVMP